MRKSECKSRATGKKKKIQQFQSLVVKLEVCPHFLVFGFALLMEVWLHCFVSQRELDHILEMILYQDMGLRVWPHPLAVGLSLRMELRPHHLRMEVLGSN
uniref:Uncharacterized protein n=1 Tax=Cacopsylla melanoneura TaxID=428564 RepID=A0A8D9ENQ2_9HEMI